MSAEILRKAAALMRERAEAATEGPWSASLVTSPRSNSTSAIYSLALPPGSEVVGSTPKHGGIWRAADAAHIASWHPAVALAVADWLDGVAAEWERWPGPALTRDEPALAVARAYIGEGGD